MSIALKLAEKNLGKVAPNPTVGCVIVKDNVIIGEGCTGIAGRPHAEIVALKNTRVSPDGATMYISLEPCCHYGTTGPCTTEIIKSKIKRVVIAVIDPDKRVAGQGINILREAGIEVVHGVMKEEAKELNIGFFFTKKFYRPFITCKVAATLDGKIATFMDESKWITGSKTRDWVHKLRSHYDAIMIGSNTLVSDDPMLTCRFEPSFGPIRLVMDSTGQLKQEHNIAKTANKIQTWVITTVNVKTKIEHINYLVVKANQDGKVCLENMVSQLVLEIGITRVLVEGGGILITKLLQRRLIDRLIICRSGKILGNDAKPFIGNLGIGSLNQCHRFHKIKIIDSAEDIIEIWDCSDLKKDFTLLS